MATFLDRYEESAGIKKPAASAPVPEPVVEPKSIFQRVKSALGIGTDAATAAPAPAPKRLSAIEQYEKANIVVKSSTPEEAKRASQASFVDTTPPEVRKTGEEAFVLARGPSTPKQLIGGNEQGFLDDPIRAKDYMDAARSDRPDGLVSRLKSGWDSYVNATKRFSRNVAIGEIATLQSFLGAVEWLAPDKIVDNGKPNDGSIELEPGPLKRIAKDKGDRLEKWLADLQSQQPDPTFMDKLSQGIGSSAVFFVPGLGAARATTALASVSPRVAMLFGGSASAALEAMSEAGNVYRSVLAEKSGSIPGATRLDPTRADKDANDAATKTFWANAILIGLTNRFGVFNPDTAGFVRRMIMSSPIEGVQEAAQQIISNFTTDKEDLLEGTGESFLIGSIVGGLMGGVVEGVQGQSPALIGDQNVLKPPTAPQTEGAPPQAAETAPGTAVSPETTPTSEAAPDASIAPQEPESSTLPPDVPETIFRGYGRENQAQIYTSAPVPIAGDARYFSFSEENAKKYGPDVETVRTSEIVKDPLVIRSMEEWNALTKEAGWKYPNPVGLEKAEVEQMTQELQRVIQERGHDSVIVTWPKDARDIGPNGENIKGLRRVFGEPQVIAFEASGQYAVPRAAADEQRELTAKESVEEKIAADPKVRAAEIESYLASTPKLFSEEERQGVKKEIEDEPAGKTSALGFNIKNFQSGNFDSKEAKNESDKIVARSAIAEELSRKLGVPVRSGHFKEQALGIFKPWAHVVRLKGKLGNMRIPTLVHESGHFLDYTMFGKPKKGKAIDPQNWTTTKFVSDRIPRAELDPLLQEYGGTPGSFSKKREAFAEFIRFWVTEPAKAQERAPKFLEIWETEIMKEFPEINDALLTTRQDWERWNAMPSTAKIISQISFGEKSKSWDEIKGEVVRTWYDLLAKWTDDLYPIKQFSDLAKERGVQLDLENDPYILARLARGWVGKATTFLEKGTFGVRFWKEVNGVAVPNFTGKGFAEIIAPIHKKNATEDFAAYLVARRALDLNERDIHSGVSTKDAEQALEDLRGRYPEFASIAAELDTYQNAILDYLYGSGLLTKEAYEKMRFLMKDYVPFYRVMEEAESKGFGGKTLADLRSPIKRIKGSDRDIINPLESIVKNTYAMIDAAERNRVGISMVNLSKKHPELAQLFEKVPEEKTKVASVRVNDLIDQLKGDGALEKLLGMDRKDAAKQILGEMGDEIVNIFRPSFFHDDNILTVMIEGKPQSFYVDPEIYKAMHAMEVEEPGIIWKLLSYPARWLRAGATLTPEFMVRNPARDMMSAYVYSEYGFMPPVDVARGLYSTLTSDNNFWLWRMGGGEQSMLVSMDRTTLKKTYDQLAAEHDVSGMKGVMHVAGKYKNPVEVLRLVSEFSEKMTRLGEAQKAIRRGASPLAAAFSSREVTLDFAKVGSKARSLNMIIAFFNAQIQGTVRMVRAFREHPYRTTTKTMLGITLPSILLALWNAQEPDWEEIPQFNKNLFWLFKLHTGPESLIEKINPLTIATSDGVWLRWPKPFELGILFGSIPERVIESIQYDDPNVFPELRKAVLDGATPGILPTSILPVIENVTNYSFFLDRNIVPDSLEALPAFAQYTSYTSETAKAIGKWLSYSPAKIDNLVNGYFAGLGRYATSLIDAATAAIRGEKAPEKPAPTLADIPIIKAFVVRDPVSSSSESLNRFYILAEESRASKNYYNDLIQGGKVEEAKQWYADNSAQIDLASYYDKTREALATMRRLQNMARDSKELSADEKRKRIDELGADMTDIAHKALVITGERMDAVEKSLEMKGGNE